MVAYAACAFVKRVERSYPTINKYLEKQYTFSIIVVPNNTTTYAAKACPREREIKRKRETENVTVIGS